MQIYQSLLEKKKKGIKQFALLVDPDKITEEQTLVLVEEAKISKVDLFFVGSSLLINDDFENCIRTLKENSDIPVVIFPGNSLQISLLADSILFLSLISGRNAEMLIGKHVIAAPLLKKSPVEILSTGYMLIESGTPTAVSYMSNTTPIPHNKNDIAICTAMAGEMLGLKLIFMDGGSGAKNPISPAMVTAVSKSVSVPLIIGGGVGTPEKASEICKAGADILVVGNALEKDLRLLSSIAAAVHEAVNHSG